MFDKKGLRKELVLLRNKVEDKEIKSELICNKLFSSDLWNRSSIILVYYSFKDEVNTLNIINRALRENKKVAIPKCLDDRGTMEFYYINDLDDVEEGLYGIMEPKMDCLKCYNYSRSLCLVPGLGFDKNRHRIGYGKGYYDRFLEKYEGLSIGLCYEEQIKDSLPLEQHDRKLDYVLTDKNLY